MIDISVSAAKKDISRSADQKGGRVCAYCGEHGKLTREHIWPKSIIQRVKGRKSYNPKAARLLNTEMVISDVCGPCNNGALSKLDAYGSKLYDSYFARYYSGIDPLNFEYDFQLLAKWLLKLSFNAARANESDHNRLARYAACLMDDSIDLPDDFTIAVDLLQPELIEPDQEPMLPSSNRICRIDFTKGEDDWCTVRLVSINSFYFWILIQDIPDNAVNIEHVAAVVAKIPGTALPREKSMVILRSSGAKISDLHEHWARTLFSRK